MAEKVAKASCVEQERGDLPLSSSAAPVSSMMGCLDDNTFQHILSFLEYGSLCKAMRVNRRLRNILKTNEMLWKDVCRDFWPWIDPVHSNFVVDDCASRVAAVVAAALQNNHCRSRFQEVGTVDVTSQQDGSTCIPNYRAILSLALHTLGKEPTGINEVDIQVMPELAEIVCETWTVHDNNNKLPPAVIPAYRFTGHVGPSQRCIRANKPILRPKYVVAGARVRVLPFVSPILAYNINAGKIHLQTHLSPRLVAYFEVSMHQYQQPGDNAAGRAGQNNQRHFRRECTAVGLATEEFPLHRKMPGWDSHSFGYHGDDGCLFHNTSFHSDSRRLPMFGAGDVVGCGVDYEEKAIFFTLNGNFLGYQFHLDDHMFLAKMLYPVVAMDAECLVTCNFGQRPFAFDLRNMLLNKGRGIVEHDLFCLGDDSGSDENFRTSEDNDDISESSDGDNGNFYEEEEEVEVSDSDVEEMVNMSESESESSNELNIAFRREEVGTSKSPREGI